MAAEEGSMFFLLFYINIKYDLKYAGFLLIYNSSQFELI